MEEEDISLLTLPRTPGADGGKREDEEEDEFAGLSGTISPMQFSVPRKIEDIEEEDDGDPDKRRNKRLWSSYEMFGLSVYWFGWSALMGPLLLVVLPLFVAKFAEKSKNSVLGNTLIYGSIVAVIVAPLSGSLSDTCTHQWGRRSPFIATGIIMASVALVFMAVAGSVTQLKAAFVILSIANNISMSPYTALVPDLVPPSQRGVASSWLGVMSFLGTFAGGGLTYAIHSTELCVVILGALHAFTGYLTIKICKERPLVHNRIPLTPWARAFSLFRPLGNHDFRVMFLARFLMQMGILTVQEYMVYFLKDAVRDFTLFGSRVTDDAGQAVLVIFLPMLIASLISACIAGVYSDRSGQRKLVVYVSGVIMMLSCVLFAFTRYFTLAFCVAIIFGSGYGAFSVIEWAMATDLLPNPDDFAKDMGVWSLALVLPQVISGKVASAVLETFNDLGPKDLYLGFSMIFVLALIFFIIGTVYIKKIQSIS